jgi:polysaccharide export outer membrane protein
VRRSGAITCALVLAAVMSVTSIGAQERPTVGSVRHVEVPIGLGDKVVLRVWREPTWSDAFPVDPSGDVVLPRIGRMRVVGMMPSVLEDSVRVRLATYLREPNVDLIVLRRVAVLGAVMKPDVLFVEPVTSLQDVIAQAGGLHEDGDPNRIEILRGGQRVPVGRWKDVASRPATDLQSGDQVVVGRKNWLSRNALAAVSSVAVAASVLLSALAR